MTLVQKEIKRITIRPNWTEEQIRPAKTEQITINGSLASWTNWYSLWLTKKPKKFTITYTSLHSTWWADQWIGVWIDNNNKWWFNCWDGSNYSYNRCWLETVQSWTTYTLLQDKYASTWTRQTVLTLEVDKHSVQQGNAATVSWWLASAQQTFIDWMFSNYTNLKLCCYWNKSSLSSPVVIDVEF